MLYIIEHLEEGLSDWCRLEYSHMLEIVKSPDTLIFTNVTSQATREFLTRDNSRSFESPLKSFLSGHMTLPGFPQIPFHRVCLLDMKAKRVVTPGDASEFDAVVFGGILGNVHMLPDGTYSSDDKTSIVRDLGFEENRRHVGELQMTTDSAVLVTYEVLRNEQRFEQMDFVDHPEIPSGEDVTIMDGFRYMQRDGAIVLPAGMAQLLADSMDFDLTEEM